MIISPVSQNKCCNHCTFWGKFISSKSPGLAATKLLDDPLLSSILHPKLQYAAYETLNVIKCSYLHKITTIFCEEWQTSFVLLFYQLLALHKFPFPLAQKFFLSTSFLITFVWIVITFYCFVYLVQFNIIKSTWYFNFYMIIFQHKLPLVWYKP